MAAKQFTVTVGLQYTPPSAPDNSGVVTLGTQGSTNAQQVGIIDVPNGTVIGTVFPIPFGAVSAAYCCIIKNNMSSAIGIRFNAAVADNFELAPGGEFMMSGSAAAAGTPLTQVDVVTTADPTSTEQIFSYVFGD
jgi:hypothetical protein